MELKIFASFFILILMVLSSRSTEVTTSNAVDRLRRSEPEPCSEHSPCRWGVYGSDKRKRIGFFIENPNCACGPARKCTNSEDNLSMTAYIFRCVYLPTTTTTTIAPETTPENSEAV